LTYQKYSLPSTLENFQTKEIEVLESYIELIQKHKDCPEILLYNFARAIRTQDLTKFLVYHEIFKEIIDIPGDILEIGVLEGQSLFSFAHLSEIYEHRNYTRKIIGFDDFKGYDLPDGHHIEAATTDILEEAIQLFNKSIAFNQFEKLSLVKGKIKECLPKYIQDDSQTVCALLILHFGLYDTDRKVLETVWPRIPKGGIVLMGSFSFHGDPQCTQVIDDVLGIGEIEINRFPFATKYCYIKKK